MQLTNKGARFFVNSLVALSILIPTLAFANSPNCTDPNGYQASIAFGYLQNAGITNNYKLDFKKTKVTRLASEKIGKDLYRQVTYIVFTEKSGKKIAVITVNDVSFEECSMSGGEIFVIAKHSGQSDK